MSLFCRDMRQYITRASNLIRAIEILTSELASRSAASRTRRIELEAGEFR